MPVLLKQPLCDATCTCTIKKFPCLYTILETHRKVRTSFRTFKGDIGGNSTFLCYDLNVFPKNSWAENLTSLMAPGNKIQRR